MLVKVHPPGGPEGTQFTVVESPLRVCPHVYHQVTPVVGTVVADLARVWFLARVLSDVLYVLHLVDGGVVTEGTVEGFAAGHTGRVDPENWM